MIKLYSTGCPKCGVLKKKLDDKHIDYQLISDINIVTEELLTKRGIKTVPVLEANGEFMQFKEAIKWIETIGR